jgi:hypothetical protein
MLYELLLVVALGLAVWAAVRASVLARRLERLTQSYWELRYEHVQLKARLEKAPRPTEAPGASAAETATTFVPLSAVRR